MRVILFRIEIIYIKNINKGQLSNKLLSYFKVTKYRFNRLLAPNFICKINIMSTKMLKTKLGKNSL